MKKLVCALLALCLLPVIAFADFDLSAMSVDELAALNKAVVMELMSREDFKQVPVPTGIYKVGEDIPAGTYSLKAGENYFMLKILDRNGKEIDYFSYESEIGKITLNDGETVEINHNVIFTPYAGLGF